MNAPSMPDFPVVEAGRTRRAIIFAAVAISVALLTLAGLFYVNTRLSRVERATVDSPCLTAPHSKDCHQLVHHQLQALSAGEACLIIRRAARPDSQSVLFRECLTHRHAAAAKIPGSAAPNRTTGTSSTPSTPSPEGPSTVAPSAGSTTAAPTAPASPAPTGQTPPTGSGPPPAPTPNPAPNPQPPPQPNPQPSPQPGGGAGLPLPGPVCHLAPRLC